MAAFKSFRRIKHIPSCFEVLQLFRNMSRCLNRLPRGWLVAQKFYGEAAEMAVLRDGQQLELQLEELHPQVALVPVHLFNTLHQVPSYLIVAGLVFTTLSVPFLRSEFGEEWECEAPVEMVHRIIHQRAEARSTAGPLLGLYGL